MRQRHRPVLEELEARILFSADLAALSGAHLIDTAEVRQIAPTNSSAVTGPVESSQIQTDRREIVFVDTGVDHWETLVGDIEAAAGKNNLDVVLIDASRDGIDQISAALASRNGLDAIHIISHGSDGMLQLGTARVDAATLATRATQVQAWQQALNNNADLLLYGCDVAATADGQAFVATLGRLMGADVAASDDLTGTTALGGNWTLEYHSGAIEANQLISADYQLNWQGTLATYTVTNTSDGGAGSLRAAIIAANSAGGSSTITLSAGTYTLTIAGTSEDASASGDLDITSNITIQGAGRGSTTINGVGLNDRAFDVKNGATLALQNLTVSGFDISALQYGGAIYNQGTVNLTGVSLLNNKAVSGGAVYNDTGGVFTATDTVFKDSTTTSGYGGALWNDASMTLDRVSIVNNTSTRGGGIEQNAGTLSLINATVSGNSSTYDGAGIEIVGGSATISFSTIANNSTTNSGIGGGIKLTGGSGSIANSIVFGNTAQWNGQNIDGALTSGGHNVVGSSNGFTLAGTDKSANPGLSALALDGSSGQYVQAITTSSNAYNAAGTPAPTTDQRGVTRGASADIGAYEVVTNIAPVVTTSGTALAYTENAAATAVDSGLTVADGDSTNLASATVSITTGFVSGQDTLAFTNQNGITGSWNSSTGVLTLSGSATLANYQSAMRSVTYVNTSEAPGTATRTVSFIANDGTANSAAATRNITVTAVNDAPILSSGAVVTLTGQFQNDAPPSGAAGTLVSSLVDFAVPAGQVDNVTDPDAGALLGIALTNADTTNGTWWYSINGGTNWNALGAVADNSARLLAADANTRIYFQPNTNYSGTLASAITFRAWDQTSGSNGSQADASSNGGTTAFSSATDTASLVVAPAPATLIWNTFQGAAGSDLSQSVAVDASGNIYIAGYSSATWGSPVRAFGSGNDGYVAKFDSSGNLLWNTFLGGTGTEDQANGIAVDASGNVYVVGQANATWGTPVRAYAGGVDVFVAKLNASTGALTWNTFLGAGSGTNDYGYGIAVDGSGNIYVDGDSNASWGAPIRAYSSGSDAFVAKLTSAGALSWNTFLGGTGSDGANGIAVDAGGNVYVGGFSSATWGTPARSYGGGFDMMAAKLSSAGALSWNTFMGSAGYEIANGLALDGSGNLYLSGYGDTTWGSPVQAYSGGYDAIAVKISNSGALSWNTFMGDAGSNDLGGGIALDGAGNLYLTGYSQATWGSPWSAYSGGMDAFAVQLNSSGTRTWNTFLGGSGTDSGNGVAVDGSGNVYVAGYSSATWGSPVRAYSSGDDGFLTKIYSPVPGFTVTPTSGLTTTEAGGTAQFTVVLNTAPTYDVTIGISVSDTTEATVSASSLTFTTANWNTPQTVTVTGVADSYIDGNIAYSIVTAAAVSADANYNGLNASDVALSNTDTNTYNTLYVDTVSDTVDGTTTSIAALLANKGADGKISLREAITAANATVNGPGGADVIAFNIAGGGVQTITLGTTALPGITDAIVIDGWTQPGYAGTPLIAINGINAPNSADGLSITAGGSTVRGLVIENFGHYGIYMSTGGGNLIEGNYIGTNAAGTSAAANRFGIVIASSANNTIGGTTAASRNLISGNTQDGINVSGAGATGNVILGNYIGTNAAGTGAIANSGLGIALASANNTVGGSSAGARNVISGNDLSGIEITGTAATGNTVAGNYIGLNAAGTAAIANGENGVMIDTGASGNTIGGATAAARNVISGNTQYGVIVTGQASIPANNIIQGNYLGTDAAGTAAVSNGSFGVAIDYAAASTSILDNVISGNTNAGWSASRGGIYLYANGATIQGNIIGLDATGTVALGNGGSASTAGIFEAGGSSNVLIGGTGAGQGNTIAGNTGAGVVVLADPGHIQILRNAIYGNTGLGIDLGNNGVTANDAGDADTGANNLQNFPVPSSATTNGSTIVIAGSLNSTASSYYRIEFFSSPSADASGYGEGRTYLGYANVSTNGSGNATFNTTLSVSVAAGQYVTATATKANATYTTFTDTSEFAQNVTAVAANNAPSGTNKTQTILEDASHTFSTADFGFSDSADSPANNLLAVKITTLPTVGSLTLSGSAVTAGQTITASDIAAGKLAFLPAANANGAAYASFTFQVQDDGGTSNGGVDLDPTPNTFTFNVTAVSDAPVLADTALSLTVAEDAGLPSGAVGSLVSAFTGGISDVDSGAVNGIALVASNETNGVWYYSTDGGTNWTSLGAVNSGSSLLLANNASTRLYFSPAANYNGSSTSALTLRAWDQTSGAAGTKVDTSTNGGTTAFSSATDVVDVTVTPVNDAPVLADTPLTLIVAKNAGAPSGAVGSPVNVFAGGISDVDNGAVTGIALVASNETNGTWYYTTNGGTNWTAVGTVNATSSLLLANNASTRLYFSPTTNYVGSSASALTLRAWDQTSGTAGAKVDTSSNGGATAFSSATDVIDVTVSANNVPPVNVVPGAQSTNEDTAKVFSSANGNAISITDADAGGANNQVTLSITNGTLTLAGTAGLTFVSGDGTSDATMTFRGTASAINSALNGLSYSPTANYNGSATLTLATKDSVLLSLDIDTSLLGHYTFDSGYLGDDSSPAAGNIAAVVGATSVVDGTRGTVLSLNGSDNSNLQITGTFGNPANVSLSAWVNLTAADTGGAEVISLGDNVSLRLDATYAGWGLVGSFYDGSGWVATNHSVNLAGTGWHHVAYTVNDSGNAATLFLDGVEVGSTSTTASISYTLGSGTFIGKHANGDATYDFNGLIDEARIYNRALTASEVATLANDLPMTDTDTVALTVTPVNDAPVVGSTGSALAYTENQVATAVDPGLTVGDVDNTNLASATVSITTGFVSGQDTLAFTDQNGIAGSWNSSTGVLTLSGSSTLANYQTALRSVTYVNTSDDPSTTTRTVSFVANDGTDSSAAATRNITLSAVNDAPVATITPPTYAATEQTALTLKNTGLSISDPDAGAGTLTVTLSVTEGTLTVTAGGSGAVVSNSGTASVTITGTVTQINNLLGADATSTLSYINTSDAPSASTTLTLQVSDNGNTGSGGTQSASDTATINIAAVNDAPVATITAVSYAATEQTTLTLKNTGLSISDPDAGAGTLTVTLSVTEGTLTVTAGGSGAVVSNSGTASVTITGTVTQINNLLGADATSTLSYINTSDAPSASATLTLQVSDNGNAGSGGTQTASDTAIINIAAVNDAPVATITAVSYAATEQTALTLKNTGLSISDADAGAGTLTVTLSVTEGTLTVTAGGSGAVVSNSGTASVTITGTVTQINNLLGADATSTLSYIDTSDAPSASATLTLQVSDNGNAGSGGTQTASDTAIITLSAVNDAPVLADTALTLTVAEDAGVPSGAVGSLVSAFTGGISDVDSAAVNGIAIVGSNESNGTWYYSTNGGSGWTAVGTVSSASSLLLADNASTRLYFAPAANYNGSSSAAVTLRAWDQTSGTAGTKVDTSTNGGSTAFSSATDVVDVSVTSINDAPSGTDKTRILLEDGSHTFSSADFGFTDVSDSPANSFLAVRITTLPTVGSLTLSGVAVSAGQSIAATDITAGKLVFSPVSNANGAAYASFTFQVQDDGGSGNGGIDLDQAPKTFTFDVTAVNDAPIITSHGGAPASLSAAENQTAVTTITATDADAGAVLTYTISGADAGYFSIDASSGVLTFTVAPDFEIRVDANNDGVYELTVQVADGQGGFATQALSVSVTNVNEAPTLVSLSSSSLAENTDTTGGHVVGDLTTSDPDAADSATYSIVGGADAGLFSLGGPGNNQLVLDAGVLDFETRATYQVTLRVTDAGGLSHDQSLTVNVSDVNEAPAFASTPITAATQDAAYSYTISTLDPDSGASLVITAPGLPAWMMLTDNGDGTATLSGTPGNDQVGSHGVVLQVSDGVLFASQSFTLVVANINDAPIITSHGGAPASLSAAENQTAVTTITATDADAGAVLTYTISGADAGYFSIDASSGVLTFTVAPDFENRVDANNDGVYELTVQVADGQGGFATQALSVTVTNVNEAPIAAADSFSANEDTAIAGNVLTNDTDPEGDVLNAVLVTGPSHGTLSFNADGSFRYTSAGNWFGSDSFSYRADDGSLSSAQVTVMLTVAAVNDPPAISPIALANLAEDGSLLITQANLLAGASDVDGDALTASNLALVSGSGTLADNGNGTWTFSPAANWNGASSFSFVVSDGTTSTANTANLTVTAVNDVPTSSPVTLTPITEDSGSRLITQAELLGTAADIEGDALTVSQVLIASGNGTLIDNGDGSWRYTPAANDDTSVIFSYTITDNGTTNGIADPKSLAASASLDITAVNDAPVSADGALSVAEDNSAIGQLPAATDIEGDPLTYALATTAQHGSVSVNNEGSFNYHPDADFNGNDSFSFSITDSHGASHNYGFTIVVTPVNDAPVAADLTASTMVNSLLSARLPAASDVDGDPISYALLTAASHGTVAVVSSGQFTYRPTTNYAGPDQFTYTVSDGQGGTGVYTATIDVRRTGDIGTAPPSATAPPAEANEANPLPATVPDGKGGAKAGKPVVTPPSPVLPRANPDLIDGKGLDSRDATATRSTHVMVPVEPISRRSEIDAETADLLTVDVSGLDYLWKSIFRTAGSTSHTGDGKVELEPGKPSDDQNDTQWLLDVTPAKAVGVTLSVGVVWWTIRAGGLLASLAASLPAWRGLDVTMILDDRKRRPGEAGNPADKGRA